MNYQRAKEENIHIRFPDLVALCKLEVRDEDEDEHLDLDDRELESDA